MTPSLFEKEECLVLSRDQIQAILKKNQGIIKSFGIRRLALPNKPKRLDFRLGLSLVD